MKSDHYTYPNVVLSFIYILCYFLDFDDINPNILSRDYRNRQKSRDGFNSEGFFFWNSFLDFRFHTVTHYLRSLSNTVIGRRA